LPERAPPVTKQMVLMVLAPGLWSAAGTGSASCEGGSDQEM
jgi:hypothetical protein